MAKKGTKRKTGSLQLQRRYSHGDLGESGTVQTKNTGFKLDHILRVETRKQVDVIKKQ